MFRTLKSKWISKLKPLFLISLMLLISSYVSYSQNIINSEQHSQELTIEVNNLRNQNPKEREIVKEAIEKLKEDFSYQKINVKDEWQNIAFSKSPTGNRRIFISHNITSIPSNETPKEKITTTIPAYPGCEDLTIEERITCNLIKTAELVNKCYDFDFDAVKFLLKND